MILGVFLPDSEPSVKGGGTVNFSWLSAPCSLLPFPFFSLTFQQDLAKLLGSAGGSFSGRTAGSGPVNEGSNPSPPAKTVPSSSGLGYRPLTAKTGVRFPLGLPSKIKEWTLTKVHSFLFYGVLFGFEGPVHSNPVGLSAFVTAVFQFQSKGGANKALPLHGQPECSAPAWRKNFRQFTPPREGEGTESLHPQL